ncbi:MAG: peptidase inhibitor family I36 protein [Microbacterium sp.]
MKTRFAAAVLLCLGLLVVPSAEAVRAASPSSLRGVPVMPGGDVVDGRIVYDHGSVIVSPAVVASFHDCPSGYVCLFAGTNWQGDMVQFNSCCSWNNLSAYGFNNTASSWRNRLSVDAQLAMDPGGAGTKLCLNNGSYSSSMPGGWDNVASSIRVRDAGSYC